MQSDKNEPFFNNNAEYYGCEVPREIDYYFMNFIKNKQYFKKITLLDIGGGGGRFSILCYDNINDIDIYIIDPSPKLLSLKKMSGIHVMQGSLPNNFKIQKKFHYIHIQNVLHHITGSSVSESKELVTESLMKIRDLLDDDGFILIGDLVFESYFYKPFTRTMIFYFLKIQNALNISLPLPYKDFKLGLEVYFYTTNEFKEIIEQSGYKIIEYSEFEQNIPRLSMGLVKKYAQNRICLMKL